MEALLTYWLKANAVLALFAVAYYLLLRRLTFFQLNRATLLFAVGFAVVYPLLPVPALLPAGASALVVATAGPGSLGGPAGPAPAAGFDWWQLAGAVYLAGAAGLLLRLLAQLLSLALLHRRARPAVALGQAVRVVPGAGSPFSFGRTIYLPDAALADAAALGPALRHEQAHVRQAHTLDVLLLQATTALAWANPAAWLLRRLALDNLEYLADQAALQHGELAPRAYLRLLLRQQTGAVPAPALAFHFSFSTLKNRVLMLNQPLSSSRQLGCYLLAAPLVALLALGAAGARAQTTTAVIQPAVFHPTMPENALYYLDGQLSSEQAVSMLPQGTIFDIDIIKDEPATIKRVFGNTTATSAVIITTQANANSPAVLELVEKADLGSGYIHTPAEVNAIVPKGLAYITSHYPDARLGGQVMELKKKSTGAVKYQVQLVKGKRPFYVYFSPEGDFLGE